MASIPSPVASTTSSNLRDILPNSALTDRCVPDVKCHCAGQQCDIIASNSTEAAWTQHRHRGNNLFVWQLTSNPAAFSIQQEILKQRDVSACSAILRWEWALQTLNGIVTSLFVKCTWSHFCWSITNTAVATVQGRANYTYFTLIKHFITFFFLQELVFIFLTLY